MESTGPLRLAFEGLRDLLAQVLAVSLKKRKDTPVLAGARSLGFFACR